VRSLTYDTGALIAAEAGNRDLWLLHRRSIEHGQRPVVPTVVLAQAWRGGPQPRLARLLVGCVVEPLSRLAAMATGRALARSGTSDIVDAAVVIAAAQRDGVVVTTDYVDIRRIVEALGVRVGVRQV
jgi:hypothetical protein